MAVWHPAKKVAMIVDLDISNSLVTFLKRVYCDKFQPTIIVQKLDASFHQSCLNVKNQLSD
jgi:hypothetical protein